MDELYGVDIAPSADTSRIVAANLALQPIPFPDGHFDAVSAYDFLEHMPRVFPSADYQSTRFPYIELMNEVWRVLKPGGLFYASTPVFPHQFTFIDPTHVNALTPDAHIYFTQPNRLAAMYGFIGNFAARNVHLGCPNADTVYLTPPQGFLRRMKRRYRIALGRCSHVIWELEALK
jgi:SAM-dependent methyltransferase